mgnify:CR=1 FL=1
MKKNIFKALFIVSVLTYANFGFAQKEISRAKNLMNSYDYAKASELYESAFTLYTPAKEDIKDLSHCYIQIGETQKAEKWLLKLANHHQATAKDIKVYAQFLKTEGRYDEAIEQYEKAKKLSPKCGEKLQKEIEICQNAILWLKEEPSIDVQNVEEVNTPASDYGIVFIDEKVILTSNCNSKGEKISKAYYKLYEVDFLNDSKNRRLISKLNDQHHNGPASYHPQSKTLYFTKASSTKIKRKSENADPTSWYRIGKRNRVRNNMEIYFSKYENRQWTEPQAFEHNNPAEYSVAHPAISADGKVLYFVSDMPGGQGQSDIYFCELQSNGKWGKPQNAGPTINTAGKELFPTVDKNGTLHFSSNGHPGMGGLDIFQAVGNHKNWTKVENLQAPINSPKDDFLIQFTNEDEGYFASNRTGGKGADDIYRFAPIVEKFQNITAVVKVFDKRNGIDKIVDDAHVNIKSLKTDEKIDVKKIGSQYTLSVSCFDSLKIEVTKSYYQSKTVVHYANCDIEENANLEIKLDEIEYEVGTTIVINNVYYDLDKWDIRPDAALELDKVVEVMENNPKIIVELGSHTDCRGAKDYNQRLSQRRSDSAVKYIVDKGINKNRIKAKGYGAQNLLTNCPCDECTDEEHQMNRRTEFKVVGIE